MPLSAPGFQEIYEYDKPFFPDDRMEFLKCWMAQPEGTALCILQNGKLAGYGVLSVCSNGYKLGPLFADNAELAKRLFVALKSHAPKGSPVFLDIPEVNAAAVDLANRHGMTVVFETARMYKGKCPDLPVNRLFGVTSFELG